MKIIFLDIDGVINHFPKLTDPSLAPHLWDVKVLKERGITLDIFPEQVAILNKIIEATDARIVISSSWRKGYLADWEEIVQKYKDAGGVGFILDHTPWGNPDWKHRGDEIQAWLDEHKDEVDSFVILDDCADMGHLVDNFVKTDHTVGLTDDDAQCAIDILNASVM